MNRPFSTGVVILACLCSVVSRSYAWLQPPIAVISGADPRYVCVGEVVDFYGQYSYDQDEGGESIEDWLWLFGITQPDWKSGWETYHLQCRWDSTGEKNAFLRVWDDEQTQCSNNEYVTVYVIDVQMKLEKVGNTTIEAGNNYSENTTIRVTAVDAATEETCEWFAGTVNIAEDGTNIYSQHTDKGAYLPSSVTFIPSRHHGVTTFVAKSLAGPSDESSPPGAALIKTVNYPVFGGQSLTVYQWVDNGVIDTDHAEPGVYDWFETRTMDIFSNATGEADQVLQTVGTYNDDETQYKGQVIDWDHDSPTDIELNPYSDFVRLNIPDTEPGAWTCGETLGPDHTHTVLHEARHCYQDYLSSRADLGNDDFWWVSSNNDDDEDWLVEDVDDIDPLDYILDTTDEREVCRDGEPDTEMGSFQGDNQYDAYSNAVERDAEGFAAMYYNSLP